MFDFAFLFLGYLVHVFGFFSLFFMGILVCFLQFRQVIVMWGCLVWFMRILQLIPGKIKVLQCLQMWRLYCGGSLIFAAMAIFLAVSM